MSIEYLSQRVKDLQGENCRLRAALDAARKTLSSDLLNYAELLKMNSAYVTEIQDLKANLRLIERMGMENGKRNQSNY